MKAWAKKTVYPGDLKTILIHGADAVGVTLDAQMIDSFLLYLRELKTWNQKINLTSLQEDTAIIIHHFIDSLSVVPHLPNVARILDVGSGAGFPGIPIKIARPSLNVTLIEAKRKKISFLRHIVFLLNLSQVTVVHGRVEILLRQKEPPIFDIVIARAFTKIDSLLKLVQPLLQSNSYVITMKSRKGEQELQEARPILEKMSMNIVKHIELQLPGTDKKRTLFFIKKM